jgi:paraquat-inducible protein A
MSTSKSNYYFLFIISILGFIGGLHYPLFAASGEIFGFEISKEQITFFDSIKILEEENFKELAILLYAFVIVLPGIKFFTILLNIFGIQVFGYSFNSFLLSLQKYAMVDVFVIALIAIASKSNPMFSIQLELGTYALIASVLSGIILSVWISYNSAFAKVESKTTD